MRYTFFIFGAGPRRAGLARVARLTQAGNSAGHQLASPADLPTESQLVGKRHLPNTQQL